MRNGDQRAAICAIAAALLIAPAAQAQRAAEFTASIGINTHITYTDGGYGKIDEVSKALAYLGITLLRDNVPNAQNLPRYQGMARSGFRFCFIVNGGDTTVIAQRVATFAASYPGAVEALEGPNEVNNFAFGYGGQTGTNAAIAYQSVLYSAIKATPALGAIPVYNYTDYPYHAAAADAMNLHTYPKYGAQPYAALSADLSRVQTLLAEKPRVITETGYPQMANPQQWKGPAEWNPLDEKTQAVLVLNTLLDASILGVQRVYLYQLLEAYPDTQYKDFDTRLGLFDINYRPKAAATALRNLLLLLRDNAGTSTSFALRPPPVTLRNLPPAARSLVLQRADGSDAVIIWNEEKIWDSKSRTPIAVQPATITLSPNGGLRTLSVYDPVLRQDPIATHQAAERLELPLAERPLVVILAPP